MRKILLLALGFAVATGCEEWEVNYAEEWGDWDAEGYGGGTMAFARGEVLQDSATLWGDTKGFALGTDRYGAVGMVGMVCSFNAEDGFLRMDMDPSFGEERVVDAVADPAGGFETLAVDGGQVTITGFPSEWDGVVTTDVAVDNPPEDAALTDDAIVLLQKSEQCIVERRDRLTGNLVIETTFDSPCLSNLVVDAAAGTAFVSTEEGTFGIDADGTITDFGPAASLLAHDANSGLLAKGDAGGRTVTGWETEARWTTTVDADLRSLDFVSGNRVLAGLDTGDGGALVVIDATDGTLVENVPTPRFRRVQVSPQGGMIAVRGPTALHLVRVTE